MSQTRYTRGKATETLAADYYDDGNNLESSSEYDLSSIGED